MTQDKANKIVNSFIREVPSYETSDNLTHKFRSSAIKRELGIQNAELREKLENECHLTFTDNEMECFSNDICKIKDVIDVFEPILTALRKELGEATRNEGK